MPSVSRTRASIALHALSFISTSVFCLLSYYEHSRTIHPSFLLNVYLFFSLLFDIARARTLWLRETGTVGRYIAVIFTVSVAIKAILVILEAIEKRRILRPQYKPCPPEATGNIYNRGFFWWLNSLFRRGFSNLLRVDDLFTLDKKLLSDHVHERMEAAWSKGRITAGFPQIEFKGGLSA
ncbi:hypothetical protein VTN31DRAFT_3669 [Thermomyces dupontii]|uniref:uncharacterized protein n=1 Tax=Talaromyces thermophilus TaxID=28565 RepID=UPI0037440DAE